MLERTGHDWMIYIYIYGQNIRAKRHRHRRPQGLETASYVSVLWSHSWGAGFKASSHLRLPALCTGRGAPKQHFLGTRKKEPPAQTVGGPQALHALAPVLLPSFV